MPLAIPRLTVLGAGPGGLGFAVDCMRRGISVLVYTHKNHQRTRRTIEARGYLPVKGLFEGKAKINFTNDPGEAAAYSNTLALFIRPDAHVDIWREFKHVNLQSHLLLSAPGTCVEQIVPDDITLDSVFQTMSTPISTVFSADGGIDVVARKACLSVAGTKERYKELVQNLLDTKIDWALNAIDVETQNPSGLFHPPMIIGNAHRIKNGEPFLIYAEGLTEEVITMILEVDDLRCRVREVLGFSKVGVMDCLNSLYKTEFADIKHFRDASVVHRSVKAPSTLNHRFLFEDVRVHWVLWYEIATLLGLRASSLRKSIERAGQLAKEDFFETGFTLAKLKLGYSRETFMQKYAARN